MKTRLTLEIVVSHPEDYDPAEHFTYYFSDDAIEPVVEFVDEEWETV